MKPKIKAAQLTVKRLPLADLKPHPDNPRTHPDPGTPEWDVLKRSLEHDYFDPIIFNQRNGMLVSGHLRTKILLESGYTHADCVIVDYDDPTHVARMIAANRNGGMWDDQSLADILKGLNDGGLDLALAGLTVDGLDALLVPLIPSENKPIDETAMADTQNECPKCAFKW